MLLVWVKPTPPYFEEELVTNHYVYVGESYSLALPSVVDDEGDEFSVSVELGESAEFTQFFENTISIPANMTKQEQIDVYKI